VARRPLGVDVVAAVEVDVRVERRREACEVNVVEGPPGSAFAFDDLVHVVGVPGHDRGGDERERGGLRRLAIQSLEADAAFVAVEDRVFEGVDAFVLVELAVDAAPLGGAGEIAQDELALDEAPVVLQRGGERAAALLSVQPVSTDRPSATSPSSAMTRKGCATVCARSWLPRTRF